MLPDENDDEDDDDDDSDDNVEVYDADVDEYMVVFAETLSQLFKYCNNDICSCGDIDCIRTDFVKTVLLAGIHSSDILWGEDIIKKHRHTQIKKN